MTKSRSPNDKINCSTDHKEMANMVKVTVIQCTKRTSLRMGFAKFERSNI